MQLTLAGFLGLAGIMGSVHLLPLLSEWAAQCFHGPGRFCLRGWREICFLAARFAGCCGRLSGIWRDRWNSSGANIFTAVFLKLFLKAARRLIFP